MNYENLPEIERCIGKSIRHYRMLKGLPQTKVAEFLGVSFQQLQKYETGTNRISPGKLFLLSRYFEIPIGSFFEFKDYKIAANDELYLNKDDEEVLILFKTLKDPRLKKKVLDLCLHLHNLKADQRE